MKKLLALVLSFAMILTMVQLPLVISAQDATENVVTVYVSTLGSDDGTGTADSPFATISKAMAVIEADATATAGKIIISEDDNGVDADGAEISDGITFTAAAHTKMITVCGIDGSIVINGVNRDTYHEIKGPTTFENITLKTFSIFPKGNKLVLGSGITSSGAGTIAFGFTGSVDGEDVYISNLARDGYYAWRSVYIGNAAKYVANGDVNVYIESIHTNQVQLRSGTFNGNVNVTINGFGGISGYSKFGILSSHTPVFNGAVQILWNNGIARSAFDSESFRTKAPSDRTWIMYGDKAEDGSILEMTDTVGKYQVKGGMVANAYKIDVTSTTADDGSVTYTETVSDTPVKSRGGILDVSDAPGEYKVEYIKPVAEENEDLVVYVDAENGNDVNDGKTPVTAFATIAFAEKWLNASTVDGDKTIYIIGKVQFYANVAHEDMFIYKAYDENSILSRNSNHYNKPDLYGVVTLKGPTTFDGLTSNGEDPKVHTSGHEFKFINRNTKNSAYNQFAVYVGNYGKDVVANKEKVVYDFTASYHDNTTIYVGSPTTTETVVNGADIYFIKGQLNKLTFGKNNTFTDDVSMVFDSISKRGNGYGGIVELGSNIVFQKNLQIVFNNGNKNWLLYSYNNSNIDYAPVLETLKANGGTWIIYGEKASDGSILKTTDVAGKYTVEGNLVANAYKVVDGVEATVPVQSIDGILDLTDAEGIYNVKYSTRTAIENNDSVVYVSETGSDLSNGKTAETAFGTLEFALNWMAKSTAADKKIVIVSGAEYVFTPVAYDGMLTVTSVDGKTTLKFSDTVLLSNVTFDDVILSGRIYSNGNKVVLTKLCSLADSSSGIVAGAKTADNKKQDEIIINAGGPNSWSGMFRVGATKTIASNGLKVTFNGGNFNQFVFSDWANDGVHNGDVNFVFNSGIGGYAGNSGMTDNSYGTQVFNGALQFVLNNNVKRTTLAEGVWAMTAKDGVWFMCVTAGGTLDTTADEGVFKVTSDLTAKAVNVKTGETYFSIGDYLTVPAGEYDVGFIYDENLVKNIYVSQNGSDDNNGLSEATAVKTISKALEISSKTANIIVVDTAVYDITSAYENDITIKGGKITGDVTLYGDLIIESTVIDTETIDTNGYALIIGEDVSFANGNPYVVSDKRIIINSGEYANIRIEGNDISKLYAYGSTVEEVVIATSSTEAIVKVNLEGATNFTFDNAEYKSVMIIANKATVDVEAEDAWIVGSEESGNSSVDFADVDGKFTVTTEINKIAVAVANGGETVYVADAFDNTYDEIDLDATAATTHNDFINYRGGMPNVYKKLLNNEKLNVVYFGGSVTAGAGLPTNADREVDSWRAKIGSWLTNTFPNSNIKNINKAAGESGTYLGSYRIPYLIAEDPDLLIIEYSINDYYYHSTYEDAAARFETIVREIKTALPDCDIITVLVTEKAFYTPSSNGELHEQARAHDDVAKYYNIPSIKVGCALTSQIAYADWNTYFSDIVHPTAAGYQLYYNCIEEFFDNALFHADYDDDYRFVMPPVKSTYLFDGGRTVQNITPELVAESEAMGGSGYNWIERDDGETYGGIQPSTSGTDTFYFKFYGTEVALSFSHVGADYFPLISIDGGEDFVPTVRTLAHNPIVLAMDLEPGWHTVKITSACTSLANKIQAIYYVDASEHTLQGEGADETLKNATLTLEKGTYNVKYLTAFDELVAPEKEGYEFIGWADAEGNIVTEFVAGATLTAVYEQIGLPEEDLPFDVSGDGAIDGTDLVEVMKKLLLSIVDEMFDVNTDGHSDIRDLVALKNKLASLEK